MSSSASEQDPTSGRLSWWPEMIESTDKARDAFDRFSAAMEKKPQTTHGPLPKKRHGKDRLHVKLR